MTLLISLLFGAVGGVYLAWGKKQHDALFLVTGVARILYPYLFDSVALIVIIGALAAVPVAPARGWV